MQEFFDNCRVIIAMIVLVALLGVFFVLTVALIGVAGGFGFPNNGSHTGYVTAVDTDGIFFKANTVYFKTDTQSSQEDTYCIKNSDVLNLAKEMQTSKKLVTIEYSRGIFLNPFTCSAGTVVNSIK